VQYDHGWVVYGQEVGRGFVEDIKHKGHAERSPNDPKLSSRVVCLVNMPPDQYTLSSV